MNGIWPRGYTPLPDEWTPFVYVFLIVFGVVMAYAFKPKTPPATPNQGEKK